MQIIAAKDLNALDIDIKKSDHVVIDMRNSLLTILHSKVCMALKCENQRITHRRCYFCENHQDGEVDEIKLPADFVYIGNDPAAIQARFSIEGSVVRNICVAVADMSDDGNVVFTMAGKIPRILSEPSFLSIHDITHMIMYNIGYVSPSSNIAHALDGYALMLDMKFKQIEHIIATSKQRDY